MQIFVKLASNQTFAMSCVEGQAIEQIQNEIRKIQGENSSQLSLLCCGKTLLNETQLQ